MPLVVGLGHTEERITDLLAGAAAIEESAAATEPSMDPVRFSQHQPLQPNQASFVAKERSKKPDSIVSIVFPHDQTFPARSESAPSATQIGLPEGSFETMKVLKPNVCSLRTLLLLMNAVFLPAIVLAVDEEVRLTPSNDACSSATSIFDLPYVENTSTRGIFRSTGVCVFSSDDPLQYGIWYSWRGDGSCLSLYSSFPAGERPARNGGEIMVAYHKFGGPSCSDRLFCGDVGYDGPFGAGAVLTFQSVQNQLYYFVFTAVDEDDRRTDVNLEIKRIPCSGVCHSDVEEVVLPANILLSESGEPTDLPVIIQGDTSLTTLPDSFNTCGGARDVNTEYFGFELPSTTSTEDRADKCYRATVTGHAFVARSTVAIFSRFLGCMGFFTNSCVRKSFVSGVERPDVLFRPVPGSFYHLIVTGNSPSDVGPYSLLVDETPCPLPVAHTNCSDAALVSRPVNIYGDFLSANLVDKSLISDCGNFDPGENSVGLWYRLEGDGLCYHAKNSLGGVKVYVGTDCMMGGNVTLACVDDTGAQAPTFRAEVGQTYHLLVWTRSRIDQFRFQLDHASRCDEFPVPPNDSCENATTVSEFPFYETGELSGATREPFRAESENCTAVQRAAATIWYELTGDGSCISVTSTNSSFDVVLAVYTVEEVAGRCAGHRCVAQVDEDVARLKSQGNIFWLTEVGVSYKLILASQDYLRNSWNGGFYEIKFEKSNTCPQVCSLCSVGAHPKDDLESIRLNRLLEGKFSYTCADASRDAMFLADDQNKCQAVDSDIQKECCDSITQQPATASSAAPTAIPTEVERLETVGPTADSPETASPSTNAQSPTAGNSPETTSPTLLDSMETASPAVDNPETASPTASGTSAQSPALAHSPETTSPTRVNLETTSPTAGSANTQSPIVDSNPETTSPTLVSVETASPKVDSPETESQNIVANNVSGNTNEEEGRVTSGGWVTTSMHPCTVAIAGMIAFV